MSIVFVIALTMSTRLPQSLYAFEFWVTYAEHLRVVGVDLYRLDLSHTMIHQTFLIFGFLSD